MQNGFYFKDNLVRSDYFLLQKMKLIHSQKNSDLTGNHSVLSLNRKVYSFCSLSDYSDSAEFILIFNNLTESDYVLMTEYLQKNGSRIVPQKILFVGHILFDYQKVLNKLISVVDHSLICVLVDNNKNPFLISEKDIKLFKNISNNVLVYQGYGSLEKKDNHIFNVKVICKVILFQFLKFLLKPLQFFKDLHATYNFRYFYGKIKLLCINIYFEMRHISVMSAIRFFYGIKVFLIRSFHFIIATVKHLAMYIFFRIRHISVISAIRFFYGIKVLLIRLYFGIIRVTQYFGIKAFYFSKHMLSMSWIYFKAALGYFTGHLIWTYYRLHEFNLRYTFYPFRKFVWFVNFQYKKRILKKI